MCILVVFSQGVRGTPYAYTSPASIFFVSFVLFVDCIFLLIICNRTIIPAKKKRCLLLGSAFLGVDAYYIK
jgi:hypothetical protein